MGIFSVKIMAMIGVMGSFPLSSLAAPDHDVRNLVPRRFTPAPRMAQIVPDIELPDPEDKAKTVPQNVELPDPIEDVPNNTELPDPSDEKVSDSRKSSPAAKPPAPIGPVVIKGYHQEQSNWCWAAVTQAAYQAYKGKFIEQCVLASRHIAKKKDNYCCLPGRAATAECNQGFETGFAISLLEMGVDKAASLPTRLKTKELIRKNGLVVATFEMKKGFSHVVLIHAESGGQFSVYDPARGNSRVDWESLNDLYGRDSLIEILGVSKDPKIRILPDPGVVPVENE